MFLTVRALVGDSTITRFGACLPRARPLEGVAVFGCFRVVRAGACAVRLPRVGVAVANRYQPFSAPSGMAQYFESSERVFALSRGSGERRPYSGKGVGHRRGLADRPGEFEELERTADLGGRQPRFASDLIDMPWARDKGPQHRVIRRRTGSTPALL